MTDTTKTNAAEAAKRVPAIAAKVIRMNPTTKAISDGPGSYATALHLVSATGKSLTLGASQLSEELQMEALIHGLKQKLVDAAAISRDAKTGRSATADDKWAAVYEVYQRLLAGQWNADREGGGTGSLLFAALCRMQPEKSPEAIQTWLAAKDDKQRKALEGNPKVAAIIAEIRTERAKATAGDVDSDALLAELDGAESEEVQP